MLFLIQVVLGILILCYIPSLYCLYRNYNVAKRVGLPIFLTPVDKFNPIWQLIGPKLLFPLMHKAPFQILSDWALFGDFGFPVPDRGRIHQRWGPAFLVVSPVGTTLVTDDPSATEDILRRTNQFIKPPQIYENIEWFGPNVDTVNHDAWSRHRRLTTPPFNERNSGLVWRESLKQAIGMIVRWEDLQRLDVIETNSDTMKLALHVLTSAGFGKTYDFNGGTAEVSPGHKMSYKDSLAGILKDTLTAVLAFKINGPSWMLSKNIIAMKECMAEFKQYMVEMVEEQRLNMHSKTNMQQDNLISALVRANEISRAEGKERYSLSEEEIYGNLFIWNLAGHDTTATTLTYAFTVLSVHREVQEWIAQEVHEVFGDTPENEWDYDTAFPKLKRCLATMYETLRHYGPVATMAKELEAPQRLSIANKDYEIPGGYQVTLNMYSIHLNKKHYGPDAEDFKPARFIRDDELAIPSASGTFLPWVTGPRVCPGKKFAQVEFVATLAACMRNHRVLAVADAGETKEQTKQRVLAVARDSEMGTNPVVKINHPERVVLQWSPA